MCPVPGDCKCVGGEWSSKSSVCVGGVLWRRVLNRSVVGVVVEEGVKQKWCVGSCGGGRQTEVVWGFLWRRVSNRSDVRVVEGVKQKWCGGSCGGGC